MTGSIYTRGKMLWLAYYDADGKQVCRSSGYRVGREADARALLDQILRTIAEKKRPVVVTGAAASAAVGRRHGPQPSAPGLTVEQYGEKWIKGRERRVQTAPDEHARLKNHVNPRIGHMLMRDVKPRHIRDFILDLSTAKVRQRGTGKGEGASIIAPRTVRHVFATIHRMFKSAVIDEEIESNPVLVEKGVLPKNVDKDPAWRATAVFDRAEVLTLISDERIAAVRRVLNALKALAAVRHGEAAGVKWCDYHPEIEPLGKLVISRSYEKARTKTQISREIPVHPTLAAILKHWRETGWKETFGRAPTADDFIVPGRDGRVWEAHDADDFFKDDLVALGLRNRRGHDLRRTFITLAQVDGARRDILKVITHGPSADDIVSLYTSFPWPTLCGEVSKLAIELPARTNGVAIEVVDQCADPIEIDEKEGIESDAAVVTTRTTVPTTAIQDSSAILSRWPGMIRRPTVYETVALPLSYTGRSVEIGTRDCAGLQAPRAGWPRRRIGP